MTADYFSCGVLSLWESFFLISSHSAYKIPLAGSVHGDPPSQTTEADNRWHPPLHPRALATRLLAGCLPQRCSWPVILEGNQFFPLDVLMNSLATDGEGIFLSLGF